MQALFRKELRNQLPFLLLVLFCGVLEIVFLFITEYPDQSPLAEELSAYDGIEYGIILALLSFSLGVGLLEREFQDGTIEFLDSLPITRSRIFVAKVLTGLSILFIFPVFVLLHLVLAQFFSRNSMDPSFHWDLFAVMVFLEWILCFVCLSIGLVLSYLKKFAWMVAALLVWTFLVLKEMEFSGIQYFNIFSLTDLIFYGQKLLLPKKHIFVQGSIASILFLISYLIFIYKNPDSRIGIAQFIQKRSAKVLFFSGTLLVFVLWIGWIAYSEKKDPHESESEVDYVQWGNARALTNHYELLYSSELSERAKSLIHGADAVYGEVSKFFGHDLKDRIAVDLTGEMERHAGRAYWKKVRMDFGYELPPEELKSVLSHETTHVFIDAMSQSKIFDKFDWTRFFHEGVATHVEYSLFASEEDHKSLRIRAAAAHSRDQITFEELVDTSEFSAKYDSDLVYPLGEIFAAVVVEQYGIDGLRKIIIAFARKDAPEDLAGVELWQDVFQSCNYNLTESINLFVAKLEAIASENEKMLSAIPRVKGAVLEEDGYIGIRPVFEGEHRIVCRFRESKDQSDEDYMYVDEEDGVFWIDEEYLPSRSFWYQLGIRVKGFPHLIYEPWVEIRR